MTDVRQNPKPFPLRARPNSQLESDLDLLAMPHLPRTTKQLAATVAKDLCPATWSWEQVRAYQRVFALLMERNAKRA